jgi:hypothetical protein
MLLPVSPDILILKEGDEALRDRQACCHQAGTSLRIPPAVLSQGSSSGPTIVLHLERHGSSFATGQVT